MLTTGFVRRLEFPLSGFRASLQENVTACTTFITVLTTGFMHRLEFPLGGFLANLRVNVNVWRLVFHER